jgi:Rieske 2Fe-2S family protein
MEQESFKKEDFPLHKAAAAEVDGMIWINLADNPIDFEEARPLISGEAKPHMLHTAKFAHVAEYTIKANWKLVYENNRDCYHCYVGHPEYIKANYDTAFIYNKNADGTFSRVTDPSVKDKDEIEKYMEEKTQLWASMGLTQCSPASSFPGSGWYRASRTPLRKGWVTESIDGKPVCDLLLGNFSERDVGSMRIHTLPNFWIHASGDHAVATRLTPSGPEETKAKVWWLVNKDAKEGVHYNLDSLLPLWKLTAEQDWYLCEWNQQGVNHSKFVPGILSEKKEAGVDKFIQWYVKKLSA